MEPILIAGGGIGGLSTALSLAQVGIPSMVLERQPELGEVGAGIQLGPNAFHALDFMGVGEGARRRAVFIDGLRLMDAVSAEEICSVPVGEEFRARFANPYAVVHRGELHAELAQGCRQSPLVELRTRAEVASISRNDEGVEVALASGERVSGSALVGADGLWSKVRAAVVGDGAPRVTGHTTYRAVVPLDAMPEDLRWNAATLWAGPRCHLVHYPLSDWKSFNLVITCHNDAPEPVAGLPVSRDEVLVSFRHIHPKAQQLVQAAEDWKLWVLCDREPVTNWSSGRVTLLGDAAHPTLQYLAQGACMAMEDAVVLAVELAGSPDSPQDAFLRYQQRRILRTARVVLQSREVGDHIYHPAGAHAMLRNQIMRSKSPQQWYEVLDWLYGATDLRAAKQELDGERT